MHLKQRQNTFYHAAMLIIAEYGVDAGEHGVSLGEDNISEEYAGPVMYIRSGCRYAVLVNADKTGHVVIVYDPNPTGLGHLMIEVVVFGCYTTAGKWGNPAVMYNRDGEMIRTHGEMNNCRDLLTDAMRSIAEEITYW